MKFEKAEYTHIGGRPVNEDACACRIVNDRYAYAIVADGLGGHGEGDAASRLVVQHLSRCGQCQALPTEENILDWMQATNDEIASLRKRPDSMKSTAVFLAVMERRAIWAHIGDSRLYHFYNGQPADITLDHSVPQMLVAAGELTRDQIPSSPDRNKILRSLGSEILNPEIHAPIDLRPGRHDFLLCTDGFWEYLDEDEIWLDLAKSATPEQWITYLRCRGEMRKRSDADNNTAAVLSVEV